MKTHLTMMIGDQSSMKHYSIDAATGFARKGEVKVSYLHDSQAIEFSNIEEMFEILEYVREIPNAYIIRGRSHDDFQTKVRRSLYHDDNQTEPNFMEVGTAWVCCDFDQYEVPENISRTSIEAIEYLIENHLPRQFANVTYIYQWSSSAGLEYKDQQIKSGTSVHLFFYLDSLLTNIKLKQWFAKRKEDGFDVSTFNTVTPIFINSEVEKDPRIIDVIDEKDKFGIIRKESNVIKAPLIKPAVSTVITLEKSIALATKNEILMELSNLGVVHRRGQGFIKLWHPQEGTKGDWFIYLKSPEVVHHHAHKSMSTVRWMKEFWGHTMVSIPDKVDAAKRLGRGMLSIKDVKNTNKI